MLRARRLSTLLISWYSTKLRVPFRFNWNFAFVLIFFQGGKGGGRGRGGRGGGVGGPNHEITSLFFLKSRVYFMAFHESRIFIGYQFTYHG